MISNQQPAHAQPSHPHQLPHAQQHPHEPQPGQPNQRLAESARYALLRRLAPALRHNMAGALQPLNMMSILLEKRLKSPSPDLVAVAKNSSQLGKASSEASKACMDVVTWLAPGSSDFASVTQAIEDATKLVATELSFKGLTIVHHPAELPVELSRSLTRSVFMAALMALTDAAVAPAQVVIRATLDAGALVLSLSLEPAPGEPFSASGSEPPYRQLDWDDVRVLADVESVQLSHTASHAALRFPARLLRLG